MQKRLLLTIVALASLVFAGPVLAQQSPDPAKEPSAATSPNPAGAAASPADAKFLNEISRRDYDPGICPWTGNDCP